MGYAESIAEQMRTLERYRTPLGRGHLLAIAESMSSEVDEAARDFAKEAIYKLAMQGLGSASPYAVSREIGRMCMAAGASLPQTRLTSDLFPTRAGWVLFAEAMPLSRGVSDFLTEGFLWNYAPIHVIEEGGEVREAILCAFAPLFRLSSIPESLRGEFGLDERKGMRDGLMFGAVHLFPVDEPWAPALPLDEETTALGTFVALLLFMRQRIVVAPERPIFGKKTRNEARRIFAREPLIRVVELRRREHQQRDEPQQRDMEYSCQWLVRGHWRQHYYPASKEHRPLWIAPHIKGPDGKPLKTPSITAYEVKR